MAKSPPPKTGTSKIRFIMVEAEIADDQIQSVTAAISNALRGPSPVAKRLPAITPQLNGNGAAEHVEEPDVVDDEDDVDTVDVTPPAPKVKKPRKPAAKPTQIDIDTESEPKLSTLVDPKSNHMRYLRIAAWLHDHRDTPVVTADHIWSCFRLLKWPTDILDFSQPLRELKFKQYFTQPERGKYAINQLGLHKAKETE